jgi:outer membrane protein assembly factor BamB
MSHTTASYGDLARTGCFPGPGVVSEPRVLRRFPMAAEPAHPTVTGGALYAGDAEGEVHALDVETGERLWHHRHGGERWAREIVRPAAVTTGAVLLQVGEQVVCHDRGSGGVRWRAEGFCPTVVDDLVLVFDDLSGLRALDAGSGQPRWQTGSRRFDGLGYGLLQTHPTVAGEMVLVAEGFEGHHTHGGLHALDRRTGAVRWGLGEGEAACTRPAPCAEPDTWEFAPYHPVWARDLVWTIGARNHQHRTVLELVGADPATGAERWAIAEEEWLDTDAHEHIDGAPVVGPELLYCRSGDRVDALEPLTGTLRWSRRTAAQIVGTPVLAGGIVHLATEGGGLHALDAATGDHRWSLTLDEPTEWSEGFAGEYDETETPFTLADGTIYARTGHAVIALG